VDKIFDVEEDEKPNRILNPEDLQRKKSSKMTFKDLNVRVESSEVSKYSKSFDSFTIKFSDDSYTYALIIMIDIKEALPKEEDEDFSANDIEKAYIKFKKYDLDTFEILGQISKNVKLKDINEDFLIDLKIELDEEFNDDDDFELET